MSLFIFTNVETAEFMFLFELRHVLADVFFVIYCKINIVLFANQKKNEMKHIFSCGMLVIVIFFFFFYYKNNGYRVILAHTSKYTLSVLNVASGKVNKNIA